MLAPWHWRVRFGVLACQCLPGLQHLPCFPHCCPAWSRHGVIVSSLPHQRQKLGAGDVLEAGDSGAGVAIEPMA